jgi:hypothetical protein
VLLLLLHVLLSAQAMERIHAILPDGTIVTDIEVFRYADGFSGRQQRQLYNSAVQQ